LLEAEPIDDPDGVIGELGCERTAQGEPLHLARQPLLVGAGMWSEYNPAAGVVRGVGRALTRPPRPLLAVWLVATAADLAAGPGGVCPQMPPCQLGDGGLVEDDCVDRCGEQALARAEPGNVLRLAAGRDGGGPGQPC